MTSPSDRELLSQGAARQLLERAGQIDSDSTSVDTLRAAAREAGISEAAFEAALIEMRGKIASQPPTRSRRSIRGIALGAAGAILAIALAVFVIIPTRGGASRAQLESHEFIVKCLPMNAAADIANVSLGAEGQVQISPGSRVMRIRASPDQFERIQARLQAEANRRSTCEK